MWNSQNASFALVALALIGGCNRRVETRPLRPRPAASASSHPTEINQPAKLTSIETGRVNPMGEAERVNCVTCHSVRRRGGLPASASELQQFHGGLVFKHGEQACGSCHRADRPDGLHLASGRDLDMADVMTLCGQCHGPQLRDYVHGAHGGMNGHWDLQRGGRKRNNCVDCHDPHSPAYAPARPVMPPRDRFLTWPEGKKEQPHG